MTPCHSNHPVLNLQSVHVVWHITSMVLVVLLPPYLAFREPIWKVPLEHLPSLLLLGVAYLAAAVVQMSSRGDAPPNRYTGFIASTSVFVSIILLAYLRPELPYSRLAISIATILGLILVNLPYIISFSFIRIAVVIPIILLVSTVGLGIHEYGLPKNEPFGFNLGSERTYIASSNHQLRLKFHTEIVGSQTVRGGAIEALGSRFILVTGIGEFYELAWTDDGSELHDRRLKIASPANRRDFISDLGDLGVSAGRYFRVSDIAIDNNSSPAELYVSHHFWKREQQCFTLRVSVASLTERIRSADWRTLFDAEPCLPVNFRFENAIRSGGRMTWLPDSRLLLSIGDHGFDGVDGNALSQQVDNDYGKIVAISRDGKHQLFSLGFRNPQGLTTDEFGNIWSTDQGPKGGDELNLIIEGGNYGWPCMTYGTQYQMTSWPIDQEADKDPKYTQPAFVWVPSPALSSLISLRSPRFPAWHGDLLASSLKRQSLYRIKLEGRRVIFAEPIKIGRRIRDLTQGEGGEIVLWTENGDIISIDSETATDSGQALFSQCLSCHDSQAAPDLKGIVGRSIGGVPGYRYSSALNEIGGNWDIPQLAKYLRNPNSFAPGTTMINPGFSDEYRLRTLLEFLNQHN